MVINKIIVKYLLAICVIILFSCSSSKQEEPKIFEIGDKQFQDEFENKQPQDEFEDEQSFDEYEDESFLFSTNKYTLDNNNYIVSTYNLPDNEKHKELLKQLSNNNVFSHFQEKLLPILTENHKNYFESKPKYELLFFTKGNIFQNNKEDYAFVIYDKEESKISILIYNESENKYLELYNEIKVEGELECYYYHYGTLDYKIGNELIYNETFLTKNTENFITYYEPCKITNILNDDDFVLESGCFAENISKKHPLNSLCISTSSVYNNWECLLYDNSKNAFKIIYGQEFAD